MAALSHPHTGAMVALMAGVPFNPVNGSCPACVQVPDLTGCTIPTLPISHCWRVLVLGPSPASGALGGWLGGPGPHGCTMFQCAWCPEKCAP